MIRDPSQRHAFISPFSNPSNPYNDCQKAIIESLGYTVLPFSISTIFSARLPQLLDRHNLIVLNWTESRAFTNSDGHARLSVRGLILLSFYLLALLFVRARVLYFIHNHYVHDSTGWQRRFSAVLISVLCRIADLRGVLDPTATERYGAHFLPHPLLGAPPSLREVAQAASRIDVPQYLIVGAIRRYKALHDVLAHWPPGVTLVIAGRADPSYAAELTALISQRGLERWVKLEVGFIADTDLQQRIREAGALILPHQPGSALVSSAFFEAIGRARRIVARRTPFLDWAAARLPGITCFDTDTELASIVAKPTQGNGVTEAEADHSVYTKAAAWFSTDACAVEYRRVLADGKRSWS